MCTKHRKLSPIPLDPGNVRFIDAHAQAMLAGHARAALVVRFKGQTVVLNQHYF